MSATITSQVRSLRSAVQHNQQYRVLQPALIDINNEFQNKVKFVLTKPVHTNDVLSRHSVREVMIRNGQLNIQRARQAQDTILKASVHAGTDMDAPMKLAILQNEIAQ
jgi:hypothetical protein